MFKEKLVELRKINNDTQESLAKRLHVSRSLVAKWEQGRSFPSINELNNICDVYNVEFESLLSKNELKAQSITKVFDNLRNDVNSYFSI